MPSNWKRSPEELHKTYIANTEAFYKTAGKGTAPELDEFIRSCALGLWSNSEKISDVHVDAYNMLFSKGQPAPKALLWELTGKVCSCNAFMPPLFFWDLTERDRISGAVTSRIFIRMLTNILLCLAAVDDEVTMSEAEYITDCSEKLRALCDSAGVKPGSKSTLNPADFVTSLAPGFKESNPVQSSAGTAGEKKEEGTSTPAEEVEKPDFDELMAKLDALVGLEDIKKDVKSLVNLVRIRQLRKDAGLPVPPMSLHLVFMGNPGTGKTTVARLLAGLYAAIGVLPKGQLIEVDRGGLVAGFVGQTALKTKEVIDSALGGVLFIDEAYALAEGGENDFGHEAIDTILKAMEDHRDELVVIVAGYTEPMDSFINANPGLQSRFNKYFNFRDYEGPELYAIFCNMLEKNGYALEEEARDFCRDFFNQLYENRDENFGNGRDVRNIFEKMIVEQANRLASVEAPSKEELMEIRKSDIPGGTEA
ncbi:MAG: AAA family ATPase [Oscillospiraceae bacterium]|nr:AAA family ATPase [Oscillospiraceae bacterium]